MIVRKLAPLVAVVVASLFAVDASSASTTTLYTDTGNSTSLYGTQWVTITNTTSTPVTLFTSSGTVTCSVDKFHHDIFNSHGRSLTGVVTDETFTSCTDTIAAINILSCKQHAALSLPTVHWFSFTSNEATVVIDDRTMRCSIQGSASACYYTAGTSVGSFKNATGSLTSFPSMQVTSPTADALPTGLCGTGGSYSVTQTHLVDQFGHTVTVRPT
jgi:hypothetical protein